MIELARKETADRAQIDRAVLGGPLPYPDGTYDLIVCALAIHYTDDRAAALAEFCRILRPGGALVVSTQHPAMDWLRKGGSYFDVKLETNIRSRRTWTVRIGRCCRAAWPGATGSRRGPGRAGTAGGTAGWLIRPGSQPAIQNGCVRLRRHPRPRSLHLDGSLARRPRRA